MSNSVILSHSGYHQSSFIEGVKGLTLPDMSGLMLQDTNPISTHRSNSSSQYSGLTPGDWGSWQTGLILSGQSLAARDIRSLHASVQ